jgi:hypothetical protein
LLHIKHKPKNVNTLLHIVILLSSLKKLLRSLTLWCMCKVLSNANPQTFGKYHACVIVKRRQLVLNYAKSPGTHTHINCDHTVYPCSTYLFLRVIISSCKAAFSRVTRTRGSQKVPGILWHQRFGALPVHTVWTECCWSFLHASFTEVAQCSSEESGRNSDFCIKIMYLATRRLLYNNSSPGRTFLSSPNHRTLRISLWATFGCSYSENSPQGDLVFTTIEDIKSNVMAELRKIAKEAFRVLTTMSGLMKQVCVWVRALLWRWLGKRCCCVVPLQCNATIPGTFWLPIVFSSLSLVVLMQSEFLSQPSCCTVAHSTCSCAQKMTSAQPSKRRLFAQDYTASYLITHSSQYMIFSVPIVEHY